MRPVAPRTGAPEETLAENQLDYSPLVVAVYVDEQGGPGCLLSRWRFTEEERALIAKGEDLYLSVGGDGHPPVRLQVGPDGWLAEQCKPWPPED